MFGWIRKLKDRLSGFIVPTPNGFKFNITWKF